MIDKKILIQEFSAKAEKNEAALFIGAGISKPYGLPDFFGLVKDLARGHIDLDVKESHNYPEIAQYILNAHKNDRSKIVNEIRAKFNISYDKNKISYLDSIAKSTISTIWTTNYDTLIEQSFKLCEKELLVKNEDGDFQQEFENRNTVELLKMHGDINSADIVITKNDYEDFNLSHRVTIRRLEQDFLTKSVLFIGYSYQDPNVQAIVNSVRQLTSGKSRNKHYMILNKEENPENEKLQKLWIEDLKRYSIHVYVLEAGFEELESIIRSISLKSKGKSVFVTGSHYNKANKIAEKLGRRLYEVDGLVLNYGGADGIGKSVCNEYVQSCITNKDSLENKICVYPNPYSFCDAWDNQDFLLGELKKLRSNLINKTQIIIAFPGNKGTLSEIELGLKKGSIIVPVFFDGEDEFRNEMLKNKYILEKLKLIDARYVEKLLTNEVNADDIVECIQRIFT